MAPVRDRIAFTRIDRWLGAAGTLLAAGLALVLWLSQAMVAPPRPRIDGSERPTIGLAVRAAPGGLRVARASGASRTSGLRAGDRIVAIDDIESPSLDDLESRVGTRPEGSFVRIRARRGPPGKEDGVLAEVPVAVRKVSPEDLGLRFEEVSFRNADGLVLRGWYVPAPASAGVSAPAVAYGHGNATDRRHWLPLAAAVHDAGFAQLLFDFTGRGESDGEVITLGLHEARDLRAALDFLAARAEVDPLRLALAGRSMGAVAAIYEAADDARVKALVLDSPYADFPALIDRALAERHVPAFLVRRLLMAVAGWRAGYDPASVKPVEAIRRVRAPMLLLHGDADRVVPYSDAKALERAATAPLLLVPLRGLGHDSPRPEEAEDRIVAFLTRSLAR
ncbi:MAG TPA: alpha/beta hydrolase [Candidatus Polarisedimenticolaceae bacterium]|nr:alpha/beta hydrolase [Candidatus Polarisedimenticolaceae bacterium]